MKEKIVFFGAGLYVIPVIEILNNNFRLELVVTTEKNETGPVPFYCISNTIPFKSVERSSNLTSYILHLKSKVAVLTSFGLIVPNEVLNLFEFGIINIHPSLLPKYRGPTPVQTALLEGETITGVSIIKLDEQVDHGPILIQEETNIQPTDTADSLYKKLFQQGAGLLVRELPNYISGKLKPIEQDHSKVTLTQPLTRESGFVDINKPPTVVQLDRMIRAYYPWPGVWFRLPSGMSRSDLDNLDNNLENKIVKLLPEEKIQVEGKNVMSFKDFSNGYPEGKEILSRLGLSSS